MELMMKPDVYLYPLMTMMSFREKFIVANATTSPSIKDNQVMKVSIALIMMDHYPYHD